MWSKVFVSFLLMADSKMIEEVLLPILIIYTNNCKTRRMTFFKIGINGQITKHTFNYTFCQHFEWSRLLEIPTLKNTIQYMCICLPSHFIECNRSIHCSSEIAFVVILIDISITLKIIKFVFMF